MVNLLAWRKFCSTVSTLPTVVVPKTQRPFLPTGSLVLVNADEKLALTGGKPVSWEKILQALKTIIGYFSPILVLCLRVSLLCPKFSFNFIKNMSARYSSNGTSKWKESLLQSIASNFALNSVSDRSSPWRNAEKRWRAFASSACLRPDRLGRVASLYSFPKRQRVLRNFCFHIIF